MRRERPLSAPPPSDEDARTGLEVAAVAKFGQRARLGADSFKEALGLLAALSGERGASADELELG